jgi:hypothetical protein
LTTTLVCVDGGEGSALAGDEFCGTEVDVFYYTIVVEEDVYDVS